MQKQPMGQVVLEESQHFNEELISRNWTKELVNYHKKQYQS